MAQTRLWREARRCTIAGTARVTTNRASFTKGRTAMSISGFARTSFAAAVLVIAMDQVQAQDIPPVNSGANPYRVIRDWGQLTQEKRPWGGSNGVAVDRDGKSVWATDRCSPGTAPGCLGTK